MTTGADISASQRYQYLVNAGFSAGDATIMTAISYLECQSCDLSSVNGTGDVGLFQINSGHWGSSTPQSSVYGDLTDPQVSARAAYAVWSAVGGGEAGFKQWCTYPGGCGGPSNVPNQISAANFASLLTNVAAQITAGDVVGAISGGAGAIGGAVGGAAGAAGSAASSAGSAAQGALQTVNGWQQGVAAIGQTFSNFWQILSTPGTWWSVLLFGGGIMLVLFGLYLAFHNQINTAVIKASEAAG